MSKNKYASEAETKTGVDGERKQRDHTKTGKLARRKETRRLEAIARQTSRVRLVEDGVKGLDVPDPIADYIKTFTVPADAIIHAKKSLSKIRGGVPHSQLDTVEFKGVAATKEAPQTAVSDKPAVERPKSKYKQKKLATA